MISQLDPALPVRDAEVVEQFVQGRGRASVQIRREDIFKSRIPGELSKFSIQRLCRP